MGFWNFLNKGDAAQDTDAELAPDSDVRLDDWVNQISGIGIQNKDKRLSHIADRPTLLSYDDLSNLYHGNSLANRVCNMFAREVVREWFSFKQDYTTASADSARDLGRDLHSFIKELKIKEAYFMATAMARLYGTAFIYLGVNDGRSPASPLDVSKIKSLDFVSVFSCRDMEAHTYYGNMLGPKYGQVKTYKVHPISLTTQPLNSQDPRIIHESRLLRFDGSVTCPVRMRSHKQGFADSVLVNMYSDLRAFGMTWNSVEALMQDFSQAVIKIEGLHKIVKQEKGTGGIFSRLMGSLMTSKSVLNAVILGEGDHYERQITPLGGIPEVLEKAMTRVASAANMPVTLVFGESPAGLNATGLSDERIWAATVSSYQDQYLRPTLEALLKIVLNAPNGPTGGAEPDYWEIEFNPLRKLTQEESAAYRKTVAEADAIYYDRKVLTSHEISLSRFGGAAYSGDTKIDVPTREKIMDTEEDLNPTVPEPLENSNEEPNSSDGDTNNNGGGNSSGPNPGIQT